MEECDWEWHHLSHMVWEQRSGLPKTKQNKKIAMLSSGKEMKVGVVGGGGLRGEDVLP